jgi:hypothetical protein
MGKWSRNAEEQSACRLRKAGVEWEPCPHNVVFMELGWSPGRF